jgi:iron complex transport system ATP-binding protein
MLEARGVTLERSGRRLLDGVNITVPRVRVTALIGPNGAGKSMLLRVLARELKPDAGSVMLDGRELTSFSAGDLARRRAMVPQATTLSFPFLVIEVVRLGASVPGFDGVASRAHRLADEALRTVDLMAFRERPYNELSGGEKQRVHIARALCQLAAAPRTLDETAVLILDEPTSSLDLPHQARVLEEARRQADTGKAVIVVIHDLNLAAAWADDLVLMSKGRILARGSPAEIFDNDLLSAAYGCPIKVNETPATGTPYMLPHLLRRESVKATAN